ncbi:MAG: hypothetical protein ACTHMF_17075, partial [Leifsonia sp.]|uniref:hypothetical protein n=1 Tax=Leifsonia sp. TaxID=1870902 RepID=UPI003F7D3464
TDVAERPDVYLAACDVRPDIGDRYIAVFLALRNSRTLRRAFEAQHREKPKLTRFAEFVEQFSEASEYPGGPIQGNVAERIAECVTLYFPVGTRLRNSEPKTEGTLLVWTVEHPSHPRLRSRIMLERNREQDELGSLDAAVECIESWFHDLMRGDGWGSLSTRLMETPTERDSRAARRRFADALVDSAARIELARRS